MVKIKTQDGETIELQTDIAYKMVLLKNLVEDLGESSEPIPLQNVTAKTFNKVLDYFKDTQSESYFHDMDRDFLFEVILAANYLDIEDLLDKGCKRVADMIKDKSVEEIKEILGIE